VGRPHYSTVKQINSRGSKPRPSTWRSARAVRPLIRDVHPDAYGRIDFKRLWLGDVRP